MCTSLQCRAQNISIPTLYTLPVPVILANCDLVLGVPPSPPSAARFSGLQTCYLLFMLPIRVSGSAALGANKYGGGLWLWMGTPRLSKSS